MDFQFHQRSLLSNTNPELSTRSRLRNALGGLLLGNRLSLAKAQGLSMDQALRSRALLPNDLQVWLDLHSELSDLLFEDKGKSGPQAAIASLRRLEHWLEATDREQFLRGNSRDFLVDLLILNAFAVEDAERVADDQAWDALEDACMGKGTDLLQFIHYLDECLADAVDPEMEDFIESFVISPDLEDQDNMLAYEEVLESRDLVDAPLQDMLRECRLLAVDSAVEPIFSGLFCFLRKGPPAQEFMETLWEFPDDLKDVLPMLCCVQAYFFARDGQGDPSWAGSIHTIAGLCR